MDWIQEGGTSIRQAHKENAGLIKIILIGIMSTIALVIFFSFIKSFFNKPSNTTSASPLGLAPTGGLFGGGGGLFGGGGGLVKTALNNPFINPLAIIPKIGGLFGR